MGKTTIGQRIFRGVEPEGGNKVNIRNTLCHCAKKQGSFTQLFTGKCITHAGAKGYMYQGIQKK